MQSFSPCNPHLSDNCECLDHMPLAMGYVPWQTFPHHTLDLCKAFHNGTIFPELCQPFCGKRGGGRC